MAHPILLFDGVCNLCESSVQFIIKRDPSGVFKFAPLQSETGQRLMRKFGLATSEINTMVLVKGELCYQKSSAALQVTKKLSWPWPIFYVFWFIPKFLRDGVYNFIAQNRYRWFGKKTACMVPTSEIRERFLN